MSEWISVDERLPEDDTLCACADFYHGISAMPDAAVFWFIHGKFVVWTDGLDAENFDGGAVITSYLNITHWMPLPEPPK